MQVSLLKEMERSPMEKALSTDIVLDIVLNHLDLEDLLEYRLVSKFWNKAASSVFRKRSTKIKNIPNAKTLTELGKCMKQSSDFPFAGLQFAEPWKFRSAGALKFFNNYGERFTSLRLYTCSTIRLQDLAPFIHHLPRLSTLEVGWSSCRPPRSKLLNSAAGQEHGRILNLPALCTFRIDCELYEDVLGEVCTAASPSLRIECLDATYETLRGLKRIGKLQAVSLIEVHEDRYDQKDYGLRVAKILSTESPALTKLDFKIDSFLSLRGLKKILISSAHTLKELRLDGIRPSEFTSECPVLTKLTTLCLRIRKSSTHVFKGRKGHKFPALQELKLGVPSCRSWFIFNDEYDPSRANLSDGLFIVPSLTRIDLDGYFNEKSIEDLAWSFPNVIEIRLKYNYYAFGSSRGSSPIDIWSVRAFEFLEKLRIWDDTVQPPKNIFHNRFILNPFIDSKKYKVLNMDSFLTGMPIATCENLRKHPQQNLMDSPFNEILRESPNILQLKNLKELVVCVKLEDGLEALPEESPFISMVSVWYALQMMPNLEAKFVYEPWEFEEEAKRDKAVTMLKAAFKHVKPYVELESFYY